MPRILPALAQVLPFRTLKVGIVVTGSKVYDRTLERKRCGRRGYALINLIYFEGGQEPDSRPGAIHCQSAPMVYVTEAGQGQAYLVAAGAWRHNAARAPRQPTSRLPGNSGNDISTSFTNESSEVWQCGPPSGRLGDACSNPGAWKRTDPSPIFRVIPPGARA